MSKRLELILVTLFLLVGFGVRTWHLTTLPMGFSREEIAAIRLIEDIRQGNIRVFFATDGHGVETQFHILAASVTALVGDGLLGYRALPLWTGALTLALTYAVTRRLFGRPVALIALLAMLFGIWPVLSARMVTHASMASLMILIILATATHAYYLGQKIHPFRPTTFSYTLLGMVIAAAVYEYYTGLLAGLGILLFVVYLRLTRQSVSRYAWWNSGYALTFAAILCLPYLISVLRNATASGPYILIAERPAGPIALLESIGRTLLAFFWRGDADPARNVPGLPFVSALEAALLAVGLSVGVRRWREPNFGLILIFFALGLLPDMWLDGGPDYSALTFLMPVTYMFIGLGVREAVRTVRQQRDLPGRLAWLREQKWLGVWPTPLVRLTLAIILLGFAANILRLRQNLFLDWPERSDVQVAYHSAVGQIAAYLDRQPDGPPVMICSSRLVSSAPDDSGQTVSDSQLLEWMLHRESIPFRMGDCRSDLVLIAGGSPMRWLFVDPAERNTMPGPLQAWAQLAEPLEHTGLPGSVAWSLDAEQALADKGGQLIAQASLYYPREAGKTHEVVPLPFKFDGNITLIGLDPVSEQETFKPGDVLTLVTYWRVDGPLPSDLGVFIRLHDTPQASPYNEVNAFKVEAARLRPRDVVVQVGYVILPETLRAQHYVLTLGVYNRQPVNQLAVYDPVTHDLRGFYLQLSKSIPVATD